MTIYLTQGCVELQKDFHKLITPRQLANLLEVSYSQLVWHIYKSPTSARYRVFSLPKKAGGNRQITAPATALRIIQRKSAQIFECVYQPRACVHGFVRGRSIVSNAKMHTRQKYVLRVDLKDFFPSINFGRVRGLFMAAPYQRNDKVATGFAQICCFDNQLPQGAPTSPIVSNMIVARMDSELQHFATENKCIYTRYADDLIFSTSVPKFPSEIAMQDVNGPPGKFTVGPQLDRIINSNGFVVNLDKVRLQIRPSRQTVTGLVVNNKYVNVQRRYIRRLRSMLYAWKRWGLERAEDEFLSKYYDPQLRNPDSDKPCFRAIVKGKIAYIAMVRGKHDNLYRNYRGKFNSLNRACNNHP